MQAKRLIDSKVILIFISSLTLITFIFFRPWAKDKNNDTTSSIKITKIDYQQKQKTPKIEELHKKDKVAKVETDKDIKEVVLEADTGIKKEEDVIPVEESIPPQATNLVGLQINSHDKVYGDRNSKVVIIEYSSPTCPHCAYYHKEIFPAIKKKYIDEKKIAYVLRLFVTNKLDLDAAIIPYCDCVGDDDNFFKWFETILNNQQSWMGMGMGMVRTNHLDKLTIIGEIGGLPKNKYKQCAKDNNITTILIENNKAALENEKFRLEPGTPAFFINGKKFEPPYSVENLSNALDKALEEAAAAAEEEIKTNG